MLKYKDKYRYLVIRIDTVEESKIIQQLFFDNDISWSGHKNFYSDKNCYYFIDYYNGREKYIDIFCGPNLPRRYSEGSDGKIYKVNEYNIIESFVKYGVSIPNYKPKRIKRIV
jgi:hypothetical protein